MFIVPMEAPGITIQPATTMYDGSFANIFYDNVRIPPENLVGEVNGGWKVLTGALAFERGLVGGGIVLKVAHAFEQLRRRVMASGGRRGRRFATTRSCATGSATLACEIEVGRQLMMHCAELAADGITPPEYGAISKVFSGELMERFGEAALDILGMRAALSEQMPGALDNGRFEQNLRHSLMWVISIGTNEIQRSLIAQRGLGLCRGRRTRVRPKAGRGRCRKTHSDGFDYVVIGAGAAGCVIANRLSADPAIRVALIEAGPSDRQFPVNLKTAVPIGNILLLPHARYNWQHIRRRAGRRQPHDHMPARQIVRRLHLRQRKRLYPWPSLGLRRMGGSR